MAKPPPMLYLCNNCEQPFAEPAPVGAGLGYASPCCDHHFRHIDEETTEERTCSTECCD